MYYSIWDAPLVLKLNPVIRGWSNYYSTGVSKATFAKLDHLVWQRIQRWCKRRHLSKSAQWIKDKYFRNVNTRNWIFSDGNYTLTTHSQVPIIRHLKVRGNKFPLRWGFAILGRTIRETSPVTYCGCHTS